MFSRYREKMKKLKAKIDAGFPAKPHLYVPVRKLEEDKKKFGELNNERQNLSPTEFNKKLSKVTSELVWCPVKFDNRGNVSRWEYKIKAGEMYEVHSESPSKEIFEVETERVPGHKKAGN